MEMSADSLLDHVSVVIPCHNGERWIGEAVKSAIGQTANVVEVIVVDDGSSDLSVQAAEAFSDDRIVVLRGTWGNGNAARNHGLSYATGEWIQFLDADDYLLSEKIAAQLAAVNDDTDVLYSPLIVRNETMGGENLNRPTLGLDLVDQWLLWQLCQTGAALWRTEALRRIGGWREGLPCCQDNELTLRALMRGLRFQYVDSPGAVYRIWSETTVCRKDPRKVVRQKTELIDACLGWLADTGRLEERYCRLAGQACFELARTLAKESIPEAAEYANGRVDSGLFCMSGPAAPPGFVRVARLFGYQNAEYLARWQRRFFRR